MSARRALAGLAFALLACAATASGAEGIAWRMDAKASRVTFTPRLAGGEFECRFERFATTLRLDPANPAHSSLQVTIDLASALTGDTERDAALQGVEFFATSRWPQARFTSTSIRALGGGRYEAAGRLSLRDVTQEIVVPFRFDPDSPATGRARLTGATTVQRLPFGVGQGEWRSTEWLDDGVRVEFALVFDAAR